MTIRALNVAEKPSVAKELAHILGNGRPHRRDGRSPFNHVFEFDYTLQGQDCRMVVTSVTGHIMEIDYPSEYSSWQSCDPITLFEAPICKSVTKDKLDLKTQLEIEARRANWLVLWLDCDREGENIAYEVISICESVNPRLRIYRARFSALIPRDIHQACQSLVAPNKRDSDAVDARQEVDLRIGSVFTRWQTLRLQNKFEGVKSEGQSLSYGPCQFPTLGFVVDRYHRIERFVPEAFWYISVTVQRLDKETKEPLSAEFAWSRNRLFDRLACLVIYEMCVKEPMATVTDIHARDRRKWRPLPMTTVTLQKLAAKKLRLSSADTMAVAEKLYQAGYLSYPRTETDSFQEGTDFKGLIEVQQDHSDWGNYARGLLQGKFVIPKAGKNNDNSHPPIHPTKSGSDLNGREKSLYELVTRHFLACCSQDALGFETTVTIEIAGEHFSASGLQVLEYNYLLVYPYEKWSDRTIPQFQRGEKFMPASCMMQEGRTTAPSMLSEPELIQLMDDNGIGTDATIATHIKTIQERGYVIKQTNGQFAPSNLGLALVEGYSSMGLDLAKPRLRAQMEAEMNGISQGRNSKDQVVAHSIQMYKEIFIKVAKEAEKLDKAVAKYFDLKGTTFQSKQDRFSRCGHCNGMMELRFSDSSQLLYCTTCKESHSLPQQREVAPSPHTCPICNFQVLSVQKSEDSSYFVCPWCFSHPPSGDSDSQTGMGNGASIGDIESLGGQFSSTRQSMPCFRCTKSSCALAGSVGADKPVRKCKSCQSNMILKKKQDGTSYFLSCTNYPNCRESFWLPSSVKTATTSTRTCPSCSHRPAPYLLEIGWNLSQMPPGIAPDELICVAGCNPIMAEELRSYTPAAPPPSSRFGRASGRGGGGGAGGGGGNKRSFDSVTTGSYWAGGEGRAYGEGRGGFRGDYGGSGRGGWGNTNGYGKRGGYGSGGGFASMAAPGPAPSGGRGGYKPTKAPKTPKGQKGSKPAAKRSRKKKP